MLGMTGGRFGASARSGSRWTRLPPDRLPSSHWVEWLTSLVRCAMSSGSNCPLHVNRIGTLCNRFRRTQPPPSGTGYMQGYQPMIARGGDTPWDNSDRSKQASWGRRCLLQAS